mmetsp:Transcript_18918/g.45468  ORF Transcript_18918/g.45468 Transcript_18918/m.45468 type:complete len:102 (-) Transcript_18918:296-601(-)
MSLRLAPTLGGHASESEPEEPQAAWTCEPLAPLVSRPGCVRSAPFVTWYLRKKKEPCLVGLKPELVADFSGETAAGGDSGESSAPRLDLGEKSSWNPMSIF